MKWLSSLVLFVSLQARAAEPVPLTNGVLDGVTVHGKSVTIDPSVWTAVKNDGQIELWNKKPKPVPVAALICVCPSGGGGCIPTVTGNEATCGGNACCGFQVIWIDPPKQK